LPSVVVAQQASGSVQRYARRHTRARGTSVIKPQQRVRQSNQKRVIVPANHQPERQKRSRRRYAAMRGRTVAAAGAGNGE